MPKTFSRSEGYTPVDFAHCALDHLTAASALFATDPSHYDSAGYLAHIGVELLLKSWLLEVAGEFRGIHSLSALYDELQHVHGAPALPRERAEVLELLDGYEQLRYPNPQSPTEVGDDDWERIEELTGAICETMPSAIAKTLEEVEPGRKAGRVLMRRARPTENNDT